MKAFTHSDIVEILDAEIKRNMDRKNKYIKNNGFDDRIYEFDAVGGELGRLLYLFKEAAGKK